MVKEGELMGNSMGDGNNEGGVMHHKCLLFIGAGDEDRTRDIQLAKLALSQLS